MDGKRNSTLPLLIKQSLLRLIPKMQRKEIAPRKSLYNQPLTYDNQRTSQQATKSFSLKMKVRIHLRMKLRSRYFNQVEAMRRKEYLTLSLSLPRMTLNLNSNRHSMTREKSIQISLNGLVFFLSLSPINELPLITLYLRSKKMKRLNRAGRGQK